MTDTRNGNSLAFPQLAGNYLLWGAALLYVAIYLFFYPPTVAIMDEAAYLNVAYALRHSGTFYIDSVNAPPVMGYSVGEHMVTQYPPGMPVIISLVSLLGWRAAMATNLIMHLAVFAVMVIILRRIKVPGEFALLYLFYPTAVIYSRTVMSDLASALLVILAFWGYLANRPWATGLCLGLAVCIRTPNGVMLLLLGLATLLDGRRGEEIVYSLRERILSVIKLGVAAFPLIALAYGYQALVQQGGWSKYAGSQFALSYFPSQFASFTLTMLVIYPLMTLAPAFYSRDGRVALRLLTYGTVIFYSFYFFHDSTDSFLETMIIGLRYILTILPLFIIAYAQVAWTVYQRFVEPRISHRIVPVFQGVVLLVLLVGTLGIHYKHQNYLKKTAAIRDGILQVVGPDDILYCNTHIAKLLNPSFGLRHIKLTSTISPESGVALVQKSIEKELADNSSRRIIVANWSRDYRPETSNEQTLIRKIEEDFIVTPLSGKEYSGLPKDLQLLQVVGRRSAVR